MNTSGLAHQAAPAQAAMLSIPRGWRTYRLKHVAKLNREVLPEMTDPDSTFRYIDIGSVDSLGRISDVEELTFGEAPSRARRVVHRGDLIVSTVRTYLRAIAQLEDLDGAVVASTGFATVTAGALVEQRFLYWWLRSTPFVEEVVARSTGVSYPAVNASDIGDIVVPVPPMDEQRRISKYLDSATARIDELLAEQDQQIVLLEERLLAERRALLLGPEGLGFPGWDYGRLKRFISIARGRFTHRPRNDPALYDGPYPFIQTGDIVSAVNGEIITWSQSLNEIGLAASRLAKKGTLVMAIAANIGDIARLGFDACFPDSIVALSGSAAVTDDYVLQLVRAIRTELIGGATLNTQLNTNVDRIGDIQVPIPPILEQKRLVEVLDQSARDVQELKLENNQQNSLLREHRQALITAGVTGGLEALREVA
ncbi:MAG TPA: restriction endonuclease subunit S [Acidimicrobiales bacterium]|nr:restriction endonuclease subunit S [Acidimicrobiales bacterium]